MDISIIISGNLTGFSRFYASANANDIYNEAKFDFDYRNFLTFINAGEKAYAISFSPKVIAVSLITRILDSFRRPGILVVTALVPRYQLVAGTLNAQDKSAIYRLLNEINDKFYEKNFLNGMVNQNPAVLMQDYYSDILRNYALVSDRMQKAINITIEVSSPNKRIGYVSSEEKDMPKYLSSLMRKSYSGYHHVFFADKAPANIDEPADEIVTYKVRVANDNRPITGEVRLDDRIPTVSPQQGEKPISNQNYTYRQVLNAEAGNEIMATLENDTIVLTYRFQPEEKTIYFKFYDGANEVPIHVIRPLIIESNGSSYPLSTDSWTFRGKEIYGLKTIKSGNSEYSVDPNSSRIDLQRLREGASHNVYVSKGWIWNFNPTINNRPVTIKPIDITLINKYTGEQRRLPRITGSTSERLSGTPNEWEMRIDSDYYESICVAATAPYKLNIKKQPVPANNGGNGTNIQSHGEGTRSHGNSSVNPGLKFTNGQNNDAKEAGRLREEQKKRYIKNGVYALIIVICFLGGWWGYTKLFPSKPIDEPKPDDPVLATETTATKDVSFRLIDFDDDELNDATLAKLSLSFEPSSIVSKSEDGKNYVITYDSTANPSQKVRVSVSFQNCNMLKKGFQNIIEIQSLDKEVVIPLSVKTSDIKLYQDIYDGVNAKDYNSYYNKVGKVSERNYDYFVVLKNLLEPQKPDAYARQKDKDQEGSKDISNKKVESKSQSNAPNFEIGWKLSDVRTKKGQDEYKGYDKQLTAIDKCLTSLKAGKVTIPKNLPSNFVEILNQLKALESRIDKITNLETQAELKRIFAEEIGKKSESVNKERDNLVGTCKLKNKIRNAERKQNNQ